MSSSAVIAAMFTRNWSSSQPMRCTAPSAARLTLKNCSQASGVAPVAETESLIFRLPAAVAPAEAARPLAAPAAECPAEKGVPDRSQGKSPLLGPERDACQGLR
jgi:hypothetical protein